MDVANDSTVVSSPTCSGALRRWFAVGMGCCWLMAFASLGLQVGALYGPDGIQPISEVLAAAALRPDGGFASMPTLLWWTGASAQLLSTVCWLGCLASLTLILGRFPRLSAFSCWFLYLSLVTPSRVFLNFQWDILILEAGFLAILFVPARSSGRLGLDVNLARAGLALLRWLLFRLMWTSGLVKLVGGDACWWDLTALRYHFETQPLPPWTAWFAHQLVLNFDWLGRASVAVMFAIELLVPLMIFGPRRVRRWAFAPLALLQLAILMSGNYGFFNWLTLLLSVTVLDDETLAALGQSLTRFKLWSRPVSRRGQTSSHVELLTAGRPWTALRVVSQAALLGLTLCLLLDSSVQMAARLGSGRAVPAPLWTLHRLMAPWRLTASYGLFTSMTKQRPEIMLEGSADGKMWKPYGFPFKPGDPTARPALVAPHQPRLDWQMWFAALSDYRRQGWLLRFQKQLLEGSPEALSLLAVNPFPDRPPRFLRAVLYDYRFSTGQQPAANDEWWARELRGLWSPVVERSSFGD